jgi:hypothetical protein
MADVKVAGRLPMSSLPKLAVWCKSPKTGQRRSL